MNSYFSVDTSPEHFPLIFIISSPFLSIFPWRKFRIEIASHQLSEVSFNLKANIE